MIRSRLENRVEQLSNQLKKEQQEVSSLTSQLAVLSTYKREIIQARTSTTSLSSRLFLFVGLGSSLLGPDI